MTPDEKPDKDKQDLTPEKSDGSELYESTESDSSAEPEPTWEILLTPSENLPPEPQQPAPSPSASSKWVPWIRASIPLVVLLIYLGYRITIADYSGRDEIVFATDEALTNSSPPDDSPKLNRDERRELEELIRDLDYQQQARSWQEMRDRINSAPDYLQQKPQIRFFSVMAKSYLGERNATLRDQARQLRPHLNELGEKKWIQRLDFLEAKILADMSIIESTLIKNTPRISSLLSSQEVLTDDSLQLRMRLARRYEELGDAEFEEAGSFRRDQINLSSARSYYQQALRWVVTREGWLDLEPVNRGEASRIVERVKVKLAKANARFHGPAIPFTGSDSDTWTGKTDEPVHDKPGGTW